MKKTILAVLAAGLAFTAIGFAAESAAFNTLADGAKKSVLPAAKLAAVVEKDRGANKVYKATTQWTKDNSNVTYNGIAKFSALEQLGVERSAEKTALQQCSAAGERSCFVSSVHITECNVFGPGSDTVCIAEAVAIAIN
jgi:hypothetical protein